MIILGLFTACEEEFVADLKNEEPTIIIEGWISSLDEPQKIIVSKTVEADQPNYREYNIPLGNLVDDALVIVSSNSQVADTLMVANDTTYGYWLGYYESNRIKGIPGETYYLTVEHNGKVYNASAYMPTVPKMDSISYENKQVEKENATLIVPLVNFQDPVNEENYYLFRSGNIYEDYITQEVYWEVLNGQDPWLISIFSDNFINGSYAKLNIREGVKTSRYWMDGNFHNYRGDKIFIQAQSLTKEAYNYYEALIAQLNYTAGVFHPAPANPPTNISNGGQGFFGATAVSRVADTIPGEHP